MGASNVASAIQTPEAYAEAFSGFEKEAAGRELAWLRSLREKGFARFSEVGFPTLRDEDWRFTNVAPIAQTPFRLARNGRGVPSSGEIARFFMRGAACTLVFVDGRFARGLSA